MNFQELINEYEKRVKELKDQRTVLFKSLIAWILKEYKDQGLERLIWQGYTPSFNDGDPCTHCQEMYVNLSDRQYDNIYDELYDKYDSEDLTDVEIEAKIKEERDRLNKFDLSFEMYQKIYSVDDYIEEKYGTNFLVTFSLDDEGKIVEEHEDFYCGY